MSNGKNQDLRFWQVVATQLRRTRYQLVSGVYCDPLQNDIAADAYALMLMAWTDLCTFPLTHDHIRNITSCLKMYPIMEVVDCLKSADEQLIEEIQRDVVCDFRAFKQRIGDLCGPVSSILNPLASLWKELQGATIRALPACDIHTCLVFIGRLNLPNRPDLQDAAREKFLLQESNLSQQYYYTTEEASILESWFPNIIDTYEDIYGKWKPCHGSGSVSEDSTLSLLDKYESLGTDEDLQYLDNFVGGTGFPRPLRTFSRIAKVQFVPKSIGRLRTICKEPATLMFYQQGFRQTITSYIHRHRYLSKRIDLHHASKNASLAMEGSVRGDFATIDLSDASDSISWRMVCDWFRFTPLFDALECTRSNRYTLDGKIHRSEKFAPMGSALCFPTMCLVFCAMCEATIVASGGNPHTSKYRVYGDDIIIETRYAEDLITRLEANGFRVNLTKSFRLVRPHNFRESCGGEFLDGYVMTPFRLSRKFSGFDVKGSSSRLGALVDLANDSYYHLPTVRRFVVSVLLDLPKRYRPLFSDVFGDGAVYSDAPTNFHLEQRYSLAYQRTQYRRGTMRALRGVREDADEDIRLYEWLRSMHGRQIQEPLSEDCIYLSHTPSKRSTQADLICSRWI